MNEAGYQETQLLSSLKSILQQHVERIELRRIDVGSTQFDATFFVSVNDEQQIDKFISALNVEFSGINVSLLEQHNIAGV